MQESDYPPIYQSANKVAATHQNRHFLCLKISLLVLIAGAGFSLFPASNQLAAVFAAVFFSIAIGLTLLMAFQKFDKAWFNARAFAESVKAQTWRYTMRAEPYDLADAAARRHFRDGLAGILKDNREALDIIPATAGAAGEITHEMDRLRTLPLPERVKYYKENRVDEQSKWYIGRAQKNRNLDTFWFALMIAFQVCALICVIIKLVSPDVRFIPTGLFTTFAGATVSWMQARRFGELSTSYNSVAHQISVVCSDYGQMSEEREFAKFVSEIEDAFSRESTRWGVRRGVSL